MGGGRVLDVARLHQPMVDAHVKPKQPPTAKPRPGKRNAARMSWTDALHAFFLKACQTLQQSGVKPTPAKLYKAMKQLGTPMDAITTRRVQSHLQKHKLKQQRLAATSDGLCSIQQPRDSAEEDARLSSQRSPLHSAADIDSTVSHVGSLEDPIPPATDVSLPLLPPPPQSLSGDNLWAFDVPESWPSLRSSGCLLKSGSLSFTGSTSDLKRSAEWAALRLSGLLAFEDWPVLSPIEAST